MQRGIVKGRGATGNAASTRFGLPAREADGDWLDARAVVDDAPHPRSPRTTVSVESPRSIIARNSSPDLPFDRSVNPYRGCEHGCVYCFARPTHAYLDLSPGLDFETKLVAKPDAAGLLRAELARPGYAAATLGMGTNTDPYQPIEDHWRVTRGVLEVLSQTCHPVSITTKSDRVSRDLDLLGPMGRKGTAAVALSITTLDAKLARILEPRAPTPAKRLAALRALADAGVPTYVAVAPVIPAITDGEIEAVLERAAEAGARGAFCIPLRLPNEVSPLFRDWLRAHFPERAGKVMTTVAAMRGGRDNDPAFFSRMKGEGPWAELIRTRFRLACRRYGLNRERISLRSDLFRPPEGDQLRLF